MNEFSETSLLTRDVLIARLRGWFLIPNRATVIQRGEEINEKYRMENIIYDLECDHVIHVRLPGPMTAHIRYRGDISINGACAYEVC